MPVTNAGIRAAFGMQDQQAPSRPAGALFQPRKPSPADYWQQRLAGQGSISAYHPSVSEKVQNTLASGLSGLGVGEAYSNRLANKAMAPLLDWTPVGNAQGIQDGAQMMTRGDLASGALGAGMLALNTLPFAGGAVGRKVGGTLGDLMRDSSGAMKRYGANDDNNLPNALNSLAEFLSDPRPLHSRYQTGDNLTLGSERGRVMSHNDTHVVLDLPSGPRLVPRTHPDLTVTPYGDW